jgi:hypothetical protein
MERLIMLREQASVLRTLAAGVDVRAVRDQILEIARRCEELAQSLEQDPRAAGLKPRDFPPDLH